MEIEKKFNFDSKSTGKDSWTRFESSRFGVQETENNLGAEGENSKRNSLEPKFIQNSNGERLVNDIGIDESQESSTEVQITSITDEELFDADNNGTVENFDMKKSTSDAIGTEMLPSKTSSVSESFSDSVILNIFNLTEDGLTLQASTENSDTVESFTFGETTVIESKISSLPDVTTADFDIFINAEKNKNNILEELVSSQANLIEDHGTFSNFFTDIEDSTSGIDNLNLGNDTESELEEILISDSSNSTNNKVDTDEMKTKNELNENDSQDVGTEIVIAQTESPKCPQPGWCIFWFLAQDTCAKDSHCLGSRLCCLWGCSKTCIDID